MMSKVYIELGEAINAIKSSRGNCDNRFYDEGLMDACSELIGLKPADVKPVCHGKWIWMGTHHVCSVCRKKYFDTNDNRRYCSNCGSKMDGGKE